MPVEPVEPADPLAAAHGCALGLLLTVPLWAVLLWVLGLAAGWW